MDTLNERAVYNVNSKKVRHTWKSLRQQSNIRLILYFFEIQLFQIWINCTESWFLVNMGFENILWLCYQNILEKQWIGTFYVATRFCALMCITFSKSMLLKNDSISKLFLMVIYYLSFFFKTGTKNSYTYEFR